MPRPKRTKIAPSGPTRVPLPAARVEVSSPRSSVRTNSDDSEGLVRRNKTGANRKGVVAKEIHMSGALQEESGAASTRVRPLGGRERAAISKVARDADHERAIEMLRKRMDEKLAAERAQKELARKTERVLVPSSIPSPIEVVRSQPEALEETRIRSVERARPMPGSAWKTQATPRTESSILALANFKRRPRQPSILQIGRQEDTSSFGDLELDLDGDDDLDDFQPNDESTPFQGSKTLLQVLAKKSPSMTPIQSAVGPVSRKRKLTPPEIQVPRSQSPAMGQVRSDQVIDEQELEPETADALSSDSEPNLPPARSSPKSVHDILSDTMAPPQSSSPIRSPSGVVPIPLQTHGPAGKSRPKRGRNTRQAAAGNSILHSKSQKLKPLSTAALQTLLPRRHNRINRRGDGFDIPSSPDASIDPSGHGEDEDELSFAAPAPRPTRGRLVAKKAKTKAATASKPTAKGQRKKGREKGAPKTYSRRASDKENVSVSSAVEDEAGTEGNDSLLPSGKEVEPLGALAPEVRREMKTLAKKFQEVDRWEMEFEDVTASSSSPNDAR